MEKSEETLSNLQDRNLGMIQVDEERELRLLKVEKPFERYQTPIIKAE